MLMTSIIDPRGMGGCEGLACSPGDVHDVVSLDLTISRRSLPWHIPPFSSPSDLYGLDTAVTANALSQRWVNVVPALHTLAQHWPSVGKTFQCIARCDSRMLGIRFNGKMGKWDQKITNQSWINLACSFYKELAEIIKSSTLVITR